MRCIDSSLDIALGATHSVHGFTCRVIQKNQLWCVIPGELYRNRQMPAKRMVLVCQMKNIRTIVDLRKKAHIVEPERQAIDQTDITHVHIPAKQIPTRKVIDHFLEVMSMPSNLPVALHCKHGVGRTGVLIGIYLMEFYGYSNYAARRYARRIGGINAFSRKQAKGRFLLDYLPSHQASVGLHP